MKQLILFRLAQITAGVGVSSGLFAGGFSLLQKGVEAKGTLELKSALISGTISAESAGLAMILVGLVVFLVPFLSKVKVSRGRINIGWCSDLAERLVLSIEVTRPSLYSGGLHGGYMVFT
jgi:hypothetical protein